MESNFQPIHDILDSEDVIDFGSNSFLRRASEFMEILRICSHQSHQKIKDQACNKSIKYLRDSLQEGVIFEVDILQPGKTEGWQKMQIKFKTSLEACLIQPEIQEPESPLDDIRQSIQEKTED
ncbi:KGK domain-containing protein [Picosynechococcus sp. PCC 7117]|uniref:KGK domain-containing protein n=1 Tax=Picosynechococcus sp. PCC 7117 TaxID=195498 RepID=UPI0008106F9B|nr:KGK domain-containing protein [Picosynechococcus sp. PCC 7117]ANV86049.1 hypothetical protein AWQ22_00360 [Picosynechococcus sp. PCC 7117]